MVAGNLADFFKYLGKKGFNGSKTMAKNVLKNPGRALKSEANVRTAFIFHSPKAALSSLPEEINRQGYTWLSQRERKKPGVFL